MARVLIVQGHARSGHELYASLQRHPATVAIPVLFLPASSRRSRAATPRCPACTSAAWTS